MQRVTVVLRLHEPLADRRLLWVTSSTVDTQPLERRLRDACPSWEVVVATSGAQGLRALGDQMFDACLVDERLSSSHAIGFLQAAPLRFSMPPTIVTHGRNDLELDRAAMEAGACAYLPTEHSDARSIERALRYATMPRETPSNETLDVVAAGSSEGLWRWSLRADEVWLSARAAALLGVDLRDGPLSGRELLCAFDPIDALMLAKARAQLLSGSSTRLQVVARCRGIHGRAVEIVGAVQRTRKHGGDNAAPELLVGGSLSEAGARATSTGTLHDPLTGLATPELFDDRIRQACTSEDPDVAIVSWTVEPPCPSSVGTTSLDAAMMESAARLEGLASRSDSVARTAPNEFCMMLRGRARERMVSMARCGGKVLGAPVETATGRLVLTVAAGCASADEVGADPFELLQRARVAAVHAADAPARADCLVLRANPRSSRIDDLECDFRRAVVRGEVFLEYQPITTSGEHELVSYEALARWTHAELGPISPRHFFELAARTSLLAELGRVLAEQACTAALAWGEELHAPNLHLNVSWAQLEAPEFAEVMSRTVRETRLPASRVRLELPDAKQALDSPASRRQIRRLANHGFFVEADASFELLDRLRRDSISEAFRGLKLPLREGTSSPGGALRRLVDRGHDLGLRITATGIETARQLGTAEQIGADALQGFLLGHPRRPEQLIPLGPASYAGAA